MLGFGEIAEKLRRSTVQIHPNGRQGGQGSGVVWSAGLILTNAHVARAPEAAIELWDGRRFPARVTSRDPRRDLATLRIDGGPPLEAATAGDSTVLRPGELVIAIGNPFGFAGALSTGVVHSIGRQWIYADVRLAPGNSGGPLADASGRVVGINTAIVNGLGAAIPSAAVLDFVHNGPRPALGVTLRPVQLGLMLIEVDPEGPAAIAGLRVGDVVLGRLEDLHASLDAGNDIVRLRFLRGDTRRVRETVVRVGARAEVAA